MIFLFIPYLRLFILILESGGTNNKRSTIIVLLWLLVRRSLSLSRNKWSSGSRLVVVQLSDRCTPHKNKDQWKKYQSRNITQELLLEVLRLLVIPCIIILIISSSLSRNKLSSGSRLASSAVSPSLTTQK